MSSKKLKHKKSVVIAFCKLLEVAKKQRDVLLLDSLDPFADSAVQEYNDNVSDQYYGSAYGRFMDSLAELFARQPMYSEAIYPEMPEQEQMEEADRLLTFILRKHACD